MFNFDALAADLNPAKKVKTGDWRMPKHPFRLLVVGPSGCGKSNLVFNMLTKWLYYDRLIVCAKDLAEDKYQLLREFMELVAKKRKRQLADVLLMTDSLSGLPNPNELDPAIQNLIVFDDQITEKDQRPIEDYFVRARKRNASMIYLSHRFFDTPKKVRANCSQVIVFRLSQKREAEGICKQYGDNLPDEVFMKLYRKCTNPKFGFLLIDTTAETLTERFRCGFDGFFIGLGEESDSESD